MASRFTYDNSVSKFVEAKQPDTDHFEVGVISYLPRECILKPEELLGANTLYSN